MDVVSIRSHVGEVLPLAAGLLGGRAGHSFRSTTTTTSGGGGGSQSGTRHHQRPALPDGDRRPSASLSRHVWPPTALFPVALSGRQASGERHLPSAPAGLQPAPARPPPPDAANYAARRRARRGARRRVARRAAKRRARRRPSTEECFYAAAARPTRLRASRVPCSASRPARIGRRGAMSGAGSGGYCCGGGTVSGSLYTRTRSSSVFYVYPEAHWSVRSQAYSLCFMTNCLANDVIETP